jgi:hypothetical protein
VNNQQVAAKFTRDGSIYAIKVLEPGQIDDNHLASLWEKARQALGTFEMYEDLVAEYLERPVS